jgi:single-strand DNA-binding protein
MLINNKVHLIGRLGMNPEIREFGDSKMARVSLATDASYRNKEGEMVQNAHWHTLVMWGPVASHAEKMLEKGKQIAINGKLINRSYKDKTGSKNYATEVHVAEFMVLER